MKEDNKHADIWLYLTIPIALLLVIAAGCGLFIPDIYRDTPYFAAQASGQDLVSLVVALPTIIITAFLASRGSLRARIIWLGGLIYLVYTYMVAAFDVKFNSLFLVYVSLLGCSLYALIGSLVTMGMEGIRKGFTQKTPVKAVSIYLAILAALFYFLWLGEIISALMEGAIPLSVVDNGTPTNAVHVLDMAWILPAFGIAAASLWRKQPFGYTLAGALLSYCVFLTSAILGMAVSMTREGYPIVAPQVIMFGLLLAISLGMLIWYLKNLKPVTPWTGNTTL